MSQHIIIIVHTYIPGGHIAQLGHSGQVVVVQGVAGVLEVHVGQVGQAISGTVVGLGHVGQGEHVSTEGKIVGHVGHVGGGKVGQVEQGVPGVCEFTIKKVYNFTVK